jgi:peptidoglycan/xylan/chitin deacetylase (PgdA/CDA1 family)
MTELHRSAPLFALEYHDVVEAGDFDASGFPGPAAASYKLPAPLFAAHLDVLGRSPAQVLNDIRSLPSASPARHCALTFDDGGSSALHVIADLLEAHQWRGHFFITTDRIGTAGFLSAPEIAELSRRGHVVGSHSRTHPVRFSHLAEVAQRAEWRDSRAALEDITGAPVDVASVPGGYFDRAVARVAAECGIRWLFTSEPSHRTWLTGECHVIGRYTLRRANAASAVQDLVGRSPLARSSQWLIWNLKKLAKVAAGDSYLRLRALLLGSDQPRA